MIKRGLTYLGSAGLGPKLVKAVSGSAGVHLASMGLTFLVGVQLARYLGPSDYGVYGLAMSIVALITIPTQFGLPPLVTREIAAAQVRSDNAAVNAVVSWSNRVVMLVSAGEAVLVVLGLLLLRGHTEGALVRTLLVGLMLVPLGALGNLRGAALRGFQQVVRGQLPDLFIRPAAFSLLLLLFWLLGAQRLSPSIAMGLHALAAGLALFSGTTMLRAVLPPRVPSDNAAPATPSSTWLASAIPMALTQGARVLQSHLVVLLLGALSVSSVVGVYRVATAVSVSITTPIALLNVVAAPFFARLHVQRDLPRLQRMLAWVAGIMLLGVLALAAPFVLAGEQILGFVFGVQYASSNVCLLVLCAGTALSAALGANSALLNMTGHEKRVTRAFLSALVCLALLAPLLIAKFGAIGAAAAQSVAISVWNVLLWLDAKRLLALDTSVLGLLRRNIARPGPTTKVDAT